MKSAITPIVKDLVLVGGGHSHAIALKLLGMNPIPGVRLTLITNVYDTPYSGMLPGYVAGLYTYDECHIDLRPLSQFAQARLIVDRAIALDLDQNQVICANHPPISFDVLSLDIGSTPATVNVPGANEYAIPVKPISQFLTYWEQLMSEVQRSPQIPLRLGIVGGGAGGVELALSVQARLDRVQTTLKGTKTELHVFHRGPELLPERHPRMRRLFQRLMVNRGIQLHLNDEVVALEATNMASLYSPGTLHEHRGDGSGGSPVATEQSEINVMGKSGAEVRCDRVFWVTSASATPWVAESGLATDEHGFIQVNDSLQSVSHPQVFAAGDIATMVNHPRPKAGVFAVRQGQPLYENLRRAVQSQPLKPFKPQKEFLILVGTGYETAIASRGSLQFGPSALIWNWKDRIDRQFMERFTDLTPMGAEQPKGRQPKQQHQHQRSALGSKNNASRPSNPSYAPALPHHQPSTIHHPPSTTHHPPSTTHHPKSKIQNPKSPMPCAGCASKVGKSVLERVLTKIKAAQGPSVQNSTAQIPPAQAPSILVGLDTADDAAVIQVPNGSVLVQTVDYFRALLDDPFMVGQITTQHCLNDLYAMGATPHSAMAIATLPYALPAKLEDTLYLLLSGVVLSLTEVGAELIGGHTVEGNELGLGLSCNGFGQPDQLWRKGGMQPGDRLILTKALGTGALFAADMQLRAKGRWIERAIASMMQSNRLAVGCLRQHGATACTDVTGFGLAGHLLEMVTASQVGVELVLEAIPVLEGAIASVEQGIVSSLYAQNAEVEQSINREMDVSDQPRYSLLFDPQTSGGLLVSVPEQEASACLDQLRSLGYSASEIIGQVTEHHYARPITVSASRLGARDLSVSRQ